MLDNSWTCWPNSPPCARARPSRRSTYGGRRMPRPVRQDVLGGARGTERSPPREAAAREGDASPRQIPAGRIVQPAVSESKVIRPESEPNISIIGHKQHLLDRGDSPTC